MTFKQDNIEKKIAIIKENLNLLRLSKPADLSPSASGGIDPRRKAIIFGNQSYPTSPLNNPAKDAKDLYKKLTDMGFKVTLLLNSNRKEMELAFQKYLNELNKGDISIFYFIFNIFFVISEIFIKFPISLNISLIFQKI